MNRLLNLAAAADYGGKVTNDESVENYANQHPYERKDYFNIRIGWHVTIADSCDSLCGPV